MSSGVGLLSLPEDLLVDKILSQIPFEALISCILTCRKLESAVNSSILLAYHKALAIEGMIDNPDISKGSIPLLERLEWLGKWKINWIAPRWSWSRSISCQIDGSLLVTSNQSGVLVRQKPRQWYIHPHELYFNQLPLSQGAQFEWEQAIKLDDTRFNGPIYAYGLATEEHGLFVYVTETNLTFRSEIHLVEYPSLSPHSLAAVPVLQWKQSFHPENDIATILVCGDHMAISYSAPSTWPGRLLSVWNWKSGAQRASMTFSDNNQTSAFIAFLREDVLISVSIRSRSIDVYWIPPIESPPFVDLAPKIEKRAPSTDDEGEEQDEDEDEDKEEDEDEDEDQDEDEDEDEDQDQDEEP